MLFKVFFIIQYTKQMPDFTQKCEIVFFSSIFLNIWYSETLTQTVTEPNEHVVVFKTFH